VRAYRAAAALLITAVAACSSSATSGPVGPGNPVQTTVPAATGPVNAVTAACTDSTSDAATIQHAIDSSAAGAMIEIEGGVCLLTKGIVFRGDRTYTGLSTTGTILKQDAGMSYVLGSQAYVNNYPGTGEPVTIRDLTVACDGSGGTDGIIVLNWQTDVEHVDVNDCGGSGIVDTNTTANGGAIDNTSVNSRFDDNFITNSGRYGFDVHDSQNSVTDGYLEDNQIASSRLDAVHLDNAAGWDISGNNLYGDAQDAINASRLYATTISDNYIEDFGYRETSGTWYGIAATAQGGVGSTIFNNKIFNGKGEGNGARYVYLAISQVNYGIGYLSVTGNVIVGVRASDVGFFYSGASDKLVVASSGNAVSQVGRATSVAATVTLTAGS
jgi:Right handed beta helix region